MMPFTFSRGPGQAVVRIDHGPQIRDLIALVVCVSLAHPAERCKSLPIFSHSGVHADHPDLPSSVSLAIHIKISLRRRQMLTFRLVAYKPAPQVTALTPPQNLVCARFVIGNLHLARHHTKPYQAARDNSHHPNQYGLRGLALLFVRSRMHPHSKLNCTVVRHHVLPQRGDHCMVQLHLLPCWPRVCDPLLCCFLHPCLWETKIFLENQLKELDAVGISLSFHLKGLLFKRVLPMDVWTNSTCNGGKLIQWLCIEVSNDQKSLAPLLVADGACELFPKLISLFALCECVVRAQHKL